MILELIDDPGFENDSPLWTWTDLAERDTEPHTGTWSAKLRSQRGGVPTPLAGKVEQLGIPVASGTVVTVSFWVKLWTLSRPSHQFSVTLYDGGSPVVLYTTTVADHTSTYGFDWVLLSFPHTMSGSTLGLEFLAFATDIIEVSAAKWWVDDVSVPLVLEGLMKGKAQAISLFMERLLTITGPPTFFSDLAGRVYNRLVTPEEHEGLVLPYLCVPLLEEGQSYPHFDRLTRTAWAMTIYGFAPERLAHNQIDSSGAVAIANLHDDIVKAILEDMRLGRYLNAPVDLLRTDSISGVDDSKYAELEMEFSMGLNFSKEDLGPTEGV